MLHFLKKCRHLLLGALLAITALGRSTYFVFAGGHEKAVIFSDAQGYYMYLPSVFIYGNFQDFPLAAADGSLVVWDEPVKNKYTYTVALLQAPFFLIADAAAAATSVPRDGRSWPYALSILIAGAFYLGLGIFLLSKILSKWFRFYIVAPSLMGIFLGTNLFYYSAIEPGVSHVYSFFLFAWFWHLTDLFSRNRKMSHFFLLGLVFGLIMVLRPTNVVVILLFLTYRIWHLQQLRERIVTFFTKAIALPLFLAGVLVALLPQVLFWRHVFDRWIVYSYGEEGFIHWDNPKILQVLADVQNGWLLYSPLMIIALLGIAILVRRHKFFGWGLVGMLALATYAFASWWAWWFGGAFGHRCYVEFTTLLSFPLALSLQWVMMWKPLWRFVVAAVVGVLLYYNLALTEMYIRTAPWDGPHWSWERFGNILKDIF